MPAYTWKASFDRACAELDLEKCRAHIYETEDAMFVRSVELIKGSIDHTGAEIELGKMDLAMDELSRLKIERLGWPGADDIKPSPKHATVSRTR
jgi:hypothetical protein